VRRAVLDVNVLISALLSPDGASAALLTRWLRGDFELVVNDALLAELSAALAFAKLRSRIPPESAAVFVDLLRREATVAATTDAPPPLHSRDPADDYLLALAATAHAVLVTWDQDLLGLTEGPVHAPASFLALLEGPFPG